MKTRKIFSFVAALLAMLMVLSACGAASSTPTATEASSQSANTQATEAAKKAADPVTITYCNFNSSGGNEETLAKMVAAFEASHPDIKVEVETIGYDDYFTQMQTRVAGGTAPDCYELNIENFAAYANKGLLAEISGVDVSGLNDTALNAFCVNGKQYGLPESFSNVVLIYNKDLFDQAGVSYPTSDWTQDDVQAAAEAIRALGDDIYGPAAPRGASCPAPRRSGTWQLFGFHQCRQSGSGFQRTWSAVKDQCLRGRFFGRDRPEIRSQPCAGPDSRRSAAWHCKKAVFSGSKSHPLVHRICGQGGG